MNFLIDEGNGALLTDDTLAGERFRLALERIREMETEEETDPAYVPYFRDAAGWVLLLLEHRRMLEDGTFETMPLEKLAAANRALYKDILPEYYDRSWANPVYAVSVFGEENGRTLSALFYELRCMISQIYEGDAERFLIRMELLLEIYCAFTACYEEYKREKADQRAQAEQKSFADIKEKNLQMGFFGDTKEKNLQMGCFGDTKEKNLQKGCFGDTKEKNLQMGCFSETTETAKENSADEAVTSLEDPVQNTEKSPVPPAESIRGKIGRFLEDYAEEETLVRVRRSLVGGSISEKIVSDYDRTGRRSLYRYGAFVSDNETDVFDYIESLDEELVAKMADTWTEGFRIGFEVTGKDLSIRRRCSILSHLGFERVTRRAVKNLEAIGLHAVIPAMEADLFTQHLGRGGGSVSTTSPNPQYAYDHREDLALFFNDVLRGRRIKALQDAYKELEAETVLYAGPLVLETFGEVPFSPKMHTECPRFTRSQQGKISRFRRQADLLYDKAVIGKERSFTIISFPVPEIVRGYADGSLKASFDEIFRAVIRINTLDYMTYRNVQAQIISTLDTAQYIHVLGTGGNRTDLTVRLQTPQDPARQTIFENCVADVNIPVGEVFTTPELSGTRGLLHVTRVYLQGLLFRDLEIRFEDGRVVDYRCGGFPTEKEGRAYIEENILFHHDTLPMGECAIGTNTTACAEAVRLGILERLPILIAEKTGPHFAVGDTCYSHEEENRVFNPDGKEIFAKENDYSRMRDTDPEKAYFGCHTDITIPYEEVGLLEAVQADGTCIPVIRDGLFVLPGTGMLNDPLLSAGLQ